jgi:hypothetical protein
MYKIPNLNTMSAFEVNNIIGTAYPVAALPEHYIESIQFNSWRDLFPEETEFHIPDQLYVQDFIIRSQADLDKIIEAECAYGFTPKVQKIIFRNTERYWCEDPNSSPFRLPQLGKSWFSDQLIALFTEVASTINMNCMKLNHVTLFEYIVERDGPVALHGRSTLNVFSLLYYAVCNNNIEIFKCGVKMGCTISDDLFKPTIKKNNFEIMNMLFERNIQINKNIEKEFCEKASPVMFELFLENYVNVYKKAPSDLLRLSLYKIDICEKIVKRVEPSTVSVEFVFGLLRIFTTESINIEVVRLIEGHFGVTMKDFIEANKEFKYRSSNFIPQEIIVRDNLGLYLHLYESGFWITEDTYETAKYYLCKNITPGLIRKHLNINNEKLRLNRTEE